jgi:hypothetical protein
MKYAWGEEKCDQKFGWKAKRKKTSWGGLDVDGRIILKYILEI